MTTEPIRNTLAPIPREGMGDMAARRLRSAILASELTPGQELRVQDLEARFGISHIPIREALRRLEGEGLIRSEPRRAPRVAPLDLDDFSAVLELRSMIEIPTARRAVEHGSDDEVRAARVGFVALTRAATDTESEEFWEAHREFHWLLVAPGANSWTRRILEPLWIENERYVRRYVSERESPEETIALHGALIEALETRDADQLAERLAHHFSVRGRWPIDGRNA